MENAGAGAHVTEHVTGHITGLAARARPPQRVAIVGAGWAGMAAAVGAAQAGHAVTVIEAARTLGGRARAVTAQWDDGTALTLDNGQHILIGAYRECLRLMRVVGVDPDTAMQRMPLSLQFPDGTGLQFPDLAPPWDALLGIARARGWSAGERIALLTRAARWRVHGFTCSATDSVTDLCAGLPHKLMQEFIDPLCVSALNTVAAESSGQVFLRVLRDSLFSGRGGSHMLLPRADLSALFPAAAARWLHERGQQVLIGQRVRELVPWHAANDSALHWQLDGEVFDAVILATPANESARMVLGAADALDANASATTTTTTTAMRDWADIAQALKHAAIATVYARTEHGDSAQLARPMLALRSGPTMPAQFVFDREPLGGPAGLLAFVVSAFEGEREALASQVLKQADVQLQLPRLRHVQTVVEKRATFQCSPQLVRPPMQIAPGLLACADYVDGPYPATLEGAVLHGTAAAAMLGE